MTGRNIPENVDGNPRDSDRRKLFGLNVPRLIDRFASDERGNMAIIAALVSMPMLYLLGTGVD